MRYDTSYAKPTAGLVTSGMFPLEWSLLLLHPADRIVLVPLGRRYDAIFLTKYALDALKGKNRHDAEALIRAGTVAGTPHWKVMVVQATTVDTLTSSGYYGQSILSASFSVQQLTG